MSPSPLSCPDGAAPKSVHPPTHVLEGRPLVTQLAVTTTWTGQVNSWAHKQQFRKNEHLSKVVSFEKGFYDTNKTLKLTADECSLGEKKVLTIYGRLNSHSYLGKSQIKAERKKQLFEPILSRRPVKETSRDSRFKPDGCRSATGWKQGRPPNVV